MNPIFNSADITMMVFCAVAILILFALDVWDGMRKTIRVGDVVVEKRMPERKLTVTHVFEGGKLLEVRGDDPFAPDMLNVDEVRKVS